MQNNFVLTILVYSLVMVLQLQSKTATLNLCVNGLHSFLCTWETQRGCHTLKPSYLMDNRLCFPWNKWLRREALTSQLHLTERLMNSSYTCFLSDAPLLLHVFTARTCCLSCDTRRLCGPWHTQHTTFLSTLLHTKANLYSFTTQHVCTEIKNNNFVTLSTWHTSHMEKTHPYNQQKKSTFVTWIRGSPQL
jgi:hypothetical protein